VELPVPYEEWINTADSAAELEMLRNCVNKETVFGAVGYSKQ
jgi:hypothetical protein